MPTTAAVTRAWPGPIAVVGLGCRLPGGIDNPLDAWEAFAEGRDAFAPFAASRLAKACETPWGSNRVDTFTQGACMLKDLALFDPALFGISPREARHVDPQQRLLLMASWAALEDACMAPRSLAGERVGVFVGASGSDYGHLVRSGDGAPFVDVYSGTGTHPSMAAGRIAHCFGFVGPAIAIDTACSSSLVAVHSACQSLHARECDVALVAGVHVLIDPKSVVLRGMLKALAPDGRCKPFSESANGFGMGEGVVVVVLKRQADALRSQDRIDASILGGAVGHNGGGMGLAVPSRDAQVRVLRQALEAAGISAETVDYLEAHGTGTALGDPIELAAVDEAYGQRTQKLVLGSAKGNFGHLEAAAGLLSLMKVALSFQAGVLPRSLHAAPLTSHVDWSELRLRVAQVNQDWPARAGPRRAGVSSFGMSGTNCHLVMEEGARRGFEETGDPPASSPQLVVISAESESALLALSTAYWDELALRPIPLDVFAGALARGRSHLLLRAAFVATDTNELMSCLASLAWSRSDPRVHLSPGVLPKRREAPILLWRKHNHSVDPGDRHALDKAIACLKERVFGLRAPASNDGASPVARAAGGEYPALVRDEGEPVVRQGDHTFVIPARLASDTRLELDLLARLYAAGSDLNWSSLYSGWAAKPRLPAYPFTLEPFWFDVPFHKPA